MLQEKRITRVETSDALTRFSDLRSLVHPLYFAFEFDRVAAKFASVEIPAGATKTVVLDAAPAYWLRAVADRDANLSALFIYE